MIFSNPLANQNLFKFNVIGIPIAWISKGLAELSVLILYQCLFNIRRGLRIAAIILEVITILIVLKCWLCTYFNCFSIQLSWDDSSNEGWCWNFEPVFKATLQRGSSPI